MNIFILVLHCKKSNLEIVEGRSENVVENFVLKFGIKCSTERKRINLCPINDCV